MVELVGDRLNPHITQPILRIKIPFRPNADFGLLDVEVDVAEFGGDVVAGLACAELDAAVGEGYLLQRITLPHHFRLNFSKFLLWKLNAAVSRVD